MGGPRKGTTNLEQCIQHQNQGTNTRPLKYETGLTTRPGVIFTRVDSSLHLKNLVVLCSEVYKIRFVPKQTAVLKRLHTLKYTDPLNCCVGEVVGKIRRYCTRTPIMQSI
jgi:hypothetical protein